MKILIAGATGLIGKALVEECLDEGVEVHYLTTRKNKIRNHKNHHGFYWNPSRGVIDVNAFEGVSAIINLAGAPIARRWTSGYKKAILESRIQTSRLLFETLKKADHAVIQYLSASGTSIYPSSLAHLYNEAEDRIAETFLGDVVVQWEAAADAFKELNIDVTKVRTGIVLSEKGGALPKMVKPIKMGIGTVFGNGEQWQSWIHINDVVGIYIFLLKNRLPGVYNAVSPNPVTNKKMTHVLAQYYQKNIWLPSLPETLLKWILGEMGNATLESQLVSSEKLLACGYRFQYVNLENAIEDLLVGT